MKLNEYEKQTLTIDKLREYCCTPSWTPPCVSFAYSCIVVSS